MYVYTCTKGNVSLKEQNSVPGNQRKLESTDDGTNQNMTDDLAPQRCTKEGSVRWMGEFLQDFIHHTPLC